MKVWYKQLKWLLLVLFIGLIFVLFISNILFSLFISINQKIIINYKNLLLIFMKNQNNNILYFNLFIIIIYLLFSIIISFLKINYFNDYIGKTYNTIFGSADWMSKKEFNKNYPLVTLSLINDNYGIVVNSYESKYGLKINIRNETNTIVVAGTRSGKTQGVVIPTLQLLARCKQQCSIIVSDPKGELFNTNSKIFKDYGFKVFKLDFRQPELSICWNPLSIIFENWIIGCKLEINYNLKIYNNQNNKYYEYQQKAIDYISDICTTLFPVNDLKEKFWQDSAASSLKGILLGILYDMKKKNTFDEKKFNLSSIISLLNNWDQLINYFNKLDMSHPARIAISCLIDGSQETTGSILQNLKIGLEKFSDPVLRSLFSKSELKLIDILKIPTIIFLVVPDDRTDRHIFASLFISQSYKILIELANFNLNKKLNKPFYYILDEFANIPKITDMGVKISISGSRNIWWLLIIQDKPQLIDKYGENIAKTINNNCSMHIFLQTMDLETAKYYSEIIGDKTIITKTRNNGLLNKYKSNSSTSSLNYVALIKPTDLMQLKKEEAIIIYSKEKPAKGKLFPMWKSKTYINGSIVNKLNIPLSDIQFSNNYIYFDIFDKHNKVNILDNNQQNNFNLLILLEKQKIIKIEKKIIEIEEIIYKYNIDNKLLKQDLKNKINEIYKLIN